MRNCFAEVVVQVSILECLDLLFIPTYSVTNKAAILTLLMDSLSYKY